MRVEARRARAVWLAVPGDPNTQTGGYLYDRRLFEELAKQGWETRVLSLDASFPVPTDAALTEARARFDEIPDGRLVVIDGLALAGLRPILPAIVQRLKPVALIHHPLADEPGLDAGRADALEQAERAALAVVPRIVVTSAWTRRRLADYGVAAQRIAVVEPGTEPRESAARRPSSAVRLLTVATVIPRKGHAVLVDALDRLGDLDWSLRCVGSLDRDARCAGDLARQIEASGVSDRVVLLGELSPERVHDEYAGADLFVLPSCLEGFGMALAEAIAHGLPVVSTTAGAIPETVPPTAARLVPPGDVEALASVLGHLIRDPGALETLAAGARRAAETLPAWPASARRFAAVLERFAIG